MAETSWGDVEPPSVLVVRSFSLSRRGLRFVSFRLAPPLLTLFPFSLTSSLLIDLSPILCNSLTFLAFSTLAFRSFFLSAGSDPQPPRRSFTLPFPSRTPTRSCSPFVRPHLCFTYVRSLLFGCISRSTPSCISYSQEEEEEETNGRGRLEPSSSRSSLPSPPSLLSRKKDSLSQKVLLTKALCLSPPLKIEPNPPSLSRFVPPATVQIRKQNHPSQPRRPFLPSSLVYVRLLQLVRIRLLLLLLGSKHLVVVGLLVSCLSQSNHPREEGRGKEKSVREQTNPRAQSSGRSRKGKRRERERGTYGSGLEEAT